MKFHKSELREAGRRRQQLEALLKDKSRLYLYPQTPVARPLLNRKQTVRVYGILSQTPGPKPGHFWLDTNVGRIRKPSGTFRMIRPLIQLAGV